MEKLSPRKDLNVTERMIMRFLSAVLFSSLLVLLDDKRRFSSIASLNKFSDGKFLVFFLIVFFAITVCTVALNFMGTKNMDAVFAMTAAMAYGLSIALNTSDIYYISVVGLAVVLVFHYITIRLGCTYKDLVLSDKKLKLILVVFFVVTAVYLGFLLLLRIYLFRTSTFDFGIFVQMFYYMKKCLIPYTTCERDVLLSHFSVHFSPIFYLILPFYALFSSPATLILVQLAAVLSGVIPMYLMCRKKNASNIATLALCLAYLLYPTLRGGLFFDFHENKFLAPLVLWLLYFFELEKFHRKKIAGIVIFTLLIVMVKEDAPIYTACIGLFQFFYRDTKKEKAAGILVAVFSVLYFFIVFYFMGIYGDAGSAITSFGRYDNLMVSGYEGVAKIVINMLKDPAYVLKQLLTAEKLEFLLWMFLPVLFLPFRTRRISTLLLLVPLVVLNLLSNYKYQHNIYYQYAYASGTLVLYTVFLELHKIKGIKGKSISVCIIVMSLLFSVSSTSDRNIYYQDYVMYHDKVDEVRTLLQKIPEDASVSASTFYVPVIAQRDEIYRYEKEADTDYIVLTLSGSEAADNMAAAEKYMENNYHLFGKVEERIIVLEKNP